MKHKSLAAKYKVNEHYDNLMKLCERAGATKELMDGSTPLPLEKVLDMYVPDWQNNKDYLAILDFRQALDEAEESQHKQAVEKLRILLRKTPVISKRWQAVNLREAGLSVKEVREVLGISRSFFSNHCRPYVTHADKEIDLLTLIEDIKDRRHMIWLNNRRREVSA